MALAGQAKTNYQREYMRSRRAAPGQADCPKTDGYIYVLNCTGSTYYKIGITRGNIEGRIQSLQTGCPYKLQLVMMFWTNEPEQLEARIHNQFNERCVNSEWFDLNPQTYCDLILTINPLVVQYLHHNPMMVGYEPPR